MSIERRRVLKQRREVALPLGDESHGEVGEQRESQNVQLARSLLLLLLEDLTVLFEDGAEAFEVGNFPVLHLLVLLNQGLRRVDSGGKVADVGFELIGRELADGEDGRLVAQA